MRTFNNNEDINDGMEMLELYKHVNCPILKKQKKRLEDLKNKYKALRLDNEDSIQVGPCVIDFTEASLDGFNIKEFKVTNLELYRKFCAPKVSVKVAKIKAA